MKFGQQTHQNYMPPNHANESNIIFRWHCELCVMSTLIKIKSCTEWILRAGSISKRRLTRIGIPILKLDDREKPSYLYVENSHTGIRRYSYIESIPITQQSASLQQLQSRDLFVEDIKHIVLATLRYWCHWWFVVLHDNTFTVNDIIFINIRSNAIFLTKKHSKTFCIFHGTYSM